MNNKSEKHKYHALLRSFLEAITNWNFPIAFMVETHPPPFSRGNGNSFLSFPPSLWLSTWSSSIFLHLSFFRVTLLFGMHKKQLSSSVTNFYYRSVLYIKINLSVSIVTNYAKNNNLLVGANIPHPKRSRGHQQNMIKVTILQYATAAFDMKKYTILRTVFVSINVNYMFHYHLRHSNCSIN